MEQETNVVYSELYVNEDGSVRPNSMADGDTKKIDQMVKSVDATWLRVRDMIERYKEEYMALPDEPLNRQERRTNKRHGDNTVMPKKIIPADFKELTPEVLSQYINDTHKELTSSFPLVAISMSHGSYNSDIFRRYLIEHGSRLPTETDEREICRIHAEYILMNSEYKNADELAKHRTRLTDQILADRTKIRDEMLAQYKAGAAVKEYDNENKRELLKKMIANITPEKKEEIINNIRQQRQHVANTPNTSDTSDTFGPR